MTTTKHFDGSFDLLPIRSHLDDGPLPTATREAFQAAACAASAIDNDGGFITWENAARAWRVEAIRARLHNPGADVAGREVMAAVAARLFAAAQAA